MQEKLSRNSTKEGDCNEKAVIVVDSGDDVFVF